MATDTGRLPSPLSQGPALKIRPYGRSDFEDFNSENAAGEHLYIGSGTIGRHVEVDCKYNWARAKWGALGHNSRPAGIVYMDLTFKQPRGYWLECASVFITLSENTTSFAVHKSRRSGESSRKMQQPLDSDCAVQIREFFGPPPITGAESRAQKTVNKSMLPTLGAMGMAELGGVGRASAVLTEVSDRWTFCGTRRKPKDGNSARTLEWELTENSMDPGQMHNQEYHTAFAFEHSLRPVFLRVEIRGRLRSSAQQFRHKFGSFSSSLGLKDNSTLTRIDLAGGVEYKKDLNEEAEALEEAMKHENNNKWRTGVPEPATPRFSNDSKPLANNIPGSNHDLGNGAGDTLTQGLLSQLNDQSVTPTPVQGGGAVEERRQESPATHSISDSADLSTRSDGTDFALISDGVDEATLSLLKVPIILHLFRFLVFLDWSWCWSRNCVIKMGEQLRISTSRNRKAIPGLVRQVGASGEPYQRKRETVVSSLASRS